MQHENVLIIAMNHKVKKNLLVPCFCNILLEVKKTRISVPSSVLVTVLYKIQVKLY